MASAIYTFGDLKADLKAEMWPAGEAESLVPAHNRAFIDAMMDIQKWVECIQQDNVTLVPQCSTYYKNGVTILPQPAHSFIKRLSTVDRINSETGAEDPESELDWTSEIIYTEVHPTAFWNYFEVCNRVGYCYPMGFFFGISELLCPKGMGPYPVPTGTTSGALELGLKYPEASTNRYRSLSGVWAKEGGQILVAPWIQSTETICIRWEGFKRVWTDDDPVDDDPYLRQAIRSYVLNRHAKNWDRDYEAAQAHEIDYRTELQILIHNCREETRQRTTEPMHARGSAGTGAGKEYRNNQSYTATKQCPAGYTGTPNVFTKTIYVGEVAIYSDNPATGQTEANNAAQQAANDYVDKQIALFCKTDVNTGYVTITNKEQIASFDCPCTDPDLINTTGDRLTAVAYGSSGHATVGPGFANKTVVDTEAARDAAQIECDALALVEAQTQAAKKAICRYFNRGGETYTKQCPAGFTGSYTYDAFEEFGEHKGMVSGMANIFYDRPVGSTMTQCEAQAEANRLGEDYAKTKAEQYMANPPVPVCVAGGGGGGGGGTGNTISNTYQGPFHATAQLHYNTQSFGQQLKNITIIVHVPAGLFYGDTQDEADGTARAAGQQHAWDIAAQIGAMPPVSEAAANAASSSCTIVYPNVGTVCV